MFNNLIESSSHAKEFRRRGSFLLFTTATYVVFFAITGVVSIFAYDAHLERQSTDLEILVMLPVEFPESTYEVVTERPRPASPSQSHRTPTQPTRTVLISSTSDPSLVPNDPGTQAVSTLPAPRGAVLGPTNENPPAFSSGGSGGPGGTGSSPLEAMPVPPPAPPAQPAPTPVRVVRISQVLNSMATYLHKPIYPPLARQTHQQGRVIVQVLIDESGKVISANATSGPPLLTGEAVRAALQTRFSPTVLNGQPIKVSGVITYNFELNQK